MARKGKKQDDRWHKRYLRVGKNWKRRQVVSLNRSKEKAFTAMSSWDEFKAIFKSLFLRDYLTVQ